jgi:hypothetical protein
MYEQIPLAILEKYPGKWIVWDQDDKQVVGVGDTVDETENQAVRAPRDHLLRVHHILPSGSEIAGML